MEASDLNRLKEQESATTGHRKAEEMDDPLAISRQGHKECRKFKRRTKCRVTCAVLFQQASRWLFIPTAPNLGSSRL
jgi:hypothetical protein